MEKLYTFTDYEDAYYTENISNCKQIGCYLLSHLKSNDQKKTDNLLHQLSNLKWNWDDSLEKQIEVNQLLQEIKIWLMVWDN